MNTKTCIFVMIAFYHLTIFGQQKVNFIFKKGATPLLQEQNGNLTNMTLEEAEETFGIINEDVSFGLSLGFNSSLENLKQAQISPLDNKLVITNAQKTSFVLSSVIPVPISYKKKAYRLLDNDGNEMGQIHKISDFSIIGIVNLVTFNEAQSGSIFNQKISGGLGLSYNFGENVAIGLSFEMISFRKPKDFLLNLNNQQILENGNMVETLDISDNKYFFDRYANTLSLKIIYKLTTR